jgi:hypothetical protein
MRLVKSVLVLVALTAFAAAASAQLRTIPKEAERGEIRHLQAMYVELNGKPLQLSPGAQIRDVDNRLVLPTSLAEKFDVRYLLDGAGLVHRVWILTPFERTQAPPLPQQPGTLPANK